MSETIKIAVNNAQKAKRSANPQAYGTKSSKNVPYDTSFPSGCPVEPLGINGDDVYFLDEKRQLRVLKSKDLNQGTIRSLFGEAGDLKYSYWPKWSKPDEDGNMRITGWRPEQAADALYNEASRRGILDIFESVRGPGCWQDPDGQLVMHCGDIVYQGSMALIPQKIGRHVYPSAPAKPHPDTENVQKGQEAAQELLSILRTWSWRRPDVDPYLLLGWISAAMLGGALKWRPLIWITGDKATGKSTLHDVIKDIMGPGGLIPSTDATAASLWQTVGHAALPIALDELEAEQDNRKAQNIIKLARHAASGGQMLRGGADHKSSSFTIRSCFLFSSILIPPMLGQDISRMAVLQLERLDSKIPPILEQRRLEEIGKLFRARLLSQWHRFPAVLHTWKAELAKAGHGGRSGDQFGTLMACYDLLVSNEMPHQDLLDDWKELLRKDTLAECEDDISDTDRCLSYLFSMPLDAYRGGERRTVGHWIMQAAGIGMSESLDNSQEKIEEAKKLLGNVGILVQDKTMPNAPKPLKIIHIANDHQGLSSLFRDSHWTGMSGTTGVWVQALRRINGSEASQQRFNGLKKRCTAIDLSKIIDVDSGGKNGL